MSNLEGGCYCGAVRFSVTPPTKWCGHCHCSICQKVHGSGVVTWVGCEADQVELNASEGALKWFESTTGAERGSCRECGSQLFFRSVNWPGELHITRTGFDGEIDREPAGSTFEDTKVHWLHLVD